MAQIPSGAVKYLQAGQLSLVLLCGMSAYYTHSIRRSISRFILKKKRLTLSIHILADGKFCFVAITFQDWLCRKEMVDYIIGDA